MGFPRSSSRPRRVPGRESRPEGGGERYGWCSSLGQKNAPAGSGPLTPPSPHSGEDGTLLAQPPRTALSPLVRSRSAPSPIPAQPLTVACWPVTTAPHDPPLGVGGTAAWGSSHPSLLAGPPFPLAPEGPRAWVSLPTSKHVVCLGEQGEGFKMAAKMAGRLSASLSVSLSLSLSCLLCSLRCYRSHRREGVGRSGDRCGVFLRMMSALGLLTSMLFASRGEAVGLCSSSQHPRGRCELVTRPQTPSLQSC